MIPNGVTVRRASLSEVDAIYSMICALENTVIDRRAFDRILHKNLESELIGYFIAEMEHTPIGMGSVHIEGLIHHAALVAEIQEMFVYEPYRSLGVGKCLMEYLVEFAKSKGAIQLEVTSRNHRENAHRFYQKEGFEKSHVKLVRYF